ncbi:class I histocompatibility antigen, F10 alpha chain isoform X3 [Ctenopharyngodon idella]|uniref:class I histocompatibility antigen, F10 alpha chain isoform X3 n=1 Tax=Ctenopharyngodon idella TaxID=7959 RepID=UPI00222FA9E1|nr:class I histocompatibility antigen, F10 alpha chain isoform X3 [Ctenopharyngodon idella]
MAKSEGDDYWERQTQILTGTEQSFKNNINVVKERFNQTGGVHSFQWMYGCELDDDGTKRGYMQFGYDGEDFLTLDKSTLTWTAAVPQATITKKKLDSTGAEANSDNNYLDNTCIEWLNKYVDYGKDTLMRKVSPQVSLLQKDPSSPVTCHATGFYPSGVTITWQRNGHDHHEDVDLGELLPNGDGTFQKSSTIRVTPDERKKNEFSCVVEHQGKTITEILKDDSFPIGIIVGVVVAVLLVVSGVVVFVVYRKKKGFKPVPQSQSSDNSSNGS